MLVVLSFIAMKEHDAFLCAPAPGLAFSKSGAPLGSAPRSAAPEPPVERQVHCPSPKWEAAVHVGAHAMMREFISYHCENHQVPAVHAALDTFNKTSLGSRGSHVRPFMVTEVGFEPKVLSCQPGLAPTGTGNLAYPTYAR